MDTRQLSNRYTLNLLKRHGCSVFWFNDKRTTSAMLRDKRTFIKKNGELYNEQIFKDLWGDECLFKEKTLPFGNTHGSSYIEGSNTYKWEYRYPEHWRNRGKAIAMIQQRYLRMKYGVLNSVVNDKVNNNSVWQFGSTLDINKIL